MSTYTGDSTALKLMREALLKVDSIAKASGLPKRLLSLIKIKASEINGCAYCMDMHIRDALAQEDSLQWIYLIPVWREAPCYTKEERAVLQWTEALTRISEQSIPERIYDEVGAVLDGLTMEKVTFAVIAINSWNRLMLALRQKPDTYTSGLNPIERTT